MGTRSDELKAGIDSTRADLADTVNELGERVSPKRVVARKTDKVRQRMAALRETVMGAADQTGSPGGVSGPARDSLGSAVDAARQAPHNLVGSAQGNPLAAGLIAFGAGLLAASVLPPSGAEQQAATQLREPAQPAVDQAREAAQELLGDMKDSVGGAAQEVRSTAAEAAGSVKEEARSAAGEVTSAASDAAGSGGT